MTIITVKDIFFIVISVIAIYYAVLNTVRYQCLKKASEMIAAIEHNNELSGKEKFATVVMWIDNDLPKIFRNATIRSMVEKLIQYAYDNAFEYMKNYVYRKTGLYVPEIIDTIKAENNDLKR